MPQGRARFRLLTGSVTSPVLIVPLGCAGSTIVFMESFAAMVEKWRGIAARGDTEFFKLFEMILDECGYKKMLEDDHETDRIENLKELIDDVKEFARTYPDSTLEEYLQLVSLYGDRDETMIKSSGII